MDKKLLTKKIEKFIAIREEEIEEKIVDVNNLSFINLRDSIIEIVLLLWCNYMKINFFCWDMQKKVLLINIRLLKP